MLNLCVSELNCLVFLNRADEFFVVSNGLSLNDHVEIQKSLEKSFDLRLSMSIGYGDNPFDANLKAYEGKKIFIEFIQKRQPSSGNDKSHLSKTFDFLNIESFSYS